MCSTYSSSTTAVVGFDAALLYVHCTTCASAALFIPAIDRIEHDSRYSNMILLLYVRACMCTCVLYVELSVSVRRA